MRVALLIIISLNFFCYSYSQHKSPEEWKALIKLSDIHLKKIIENKDKSSLSAEDVMKKTITIADEDFSLRELTSIVNICSAYCNTSTDISASLVKLLREDHPIYKNKTPTEVNQFRAFLLASLSKFPPSEEIYKYVKAELLFADHTINIAAASVTARNFPEKSSELIPLMEPFLSSSFPDEWVDITTPELNYPIIHPTKARYEIIITLRSYGASGYRSIKLLDAITECKNCGLYGYDSFLYKKALNTAEYIRKITPLCCQKETTTETANHSIVLIDKSDRNKIVEGNIRLVDEEGNSIQFNDLTDKPFVLTFFYTQCTNASKCVSTVHRLGELETECYQSDLSGKVGIYGITYDPDFDAPPIMKKYGKMYGVKFNDNTKFLKTSSNTEIALFNQLQVRVSYGAGTVNNHGIQLFIFDKKGRIAAVCDNDAWSASDVKKCLVNLMEEN